MKRFGSIVAIVAFVAGAVSARTAMAQASLGFTIDPTSGTRGTVVNGQVNTADVAANCNTTIEQLEAAFSPIVDTMANDYTFIDQYFPGCSSDPSCSVFRTDYTYEQEAYIAITFTALGIAANLDVGTGPAAEVALPQTFVMTFAQFDQTPIGTRGQFDPTTGVGSVVTPDVLPKQYPVAATCVEPHMDLVPAAITAAAALFQSLGVPLTFPDENAFISSLLDPSSNVFLGNLATQLLVPMMAPKALGVQLFTITTPTLGFTIDPTSGLPGDTVNGQVDTGDVAAQCVTDLTEFEQRFADVLNGPYAGGGNSGELFSRFFPGGDFVFENVDQAAYSLTGLTVLGIGFDFGGAAETALPQTFVMTFADLITQQPVGELGHFDPATGVGSVTVPDVTPGPWAVAAACVRPLLDVDALEAGIRKNGAYLASLGMPPDINSPEFAQWVADNFGPDADLFTLLNAIGPALIQNIVVPEALGVQLFTVLADVDHFQCYGARTTGFHGGPVTLSDRFGDRSATVRKALSLCAPANKNDEDPEAATSADFLTAYKISTSGPQPAATITATNQFGSVDLVVRKPKILLVPTAVDLDAPPSSPDGVFLNHFTCYEVRVANGGAVPSAGTVSVQTAFETAQVQPAKPKRICVPTSKNGEPVIASRPENLLCYKTKSGRGLNPPVTAYLANQFGQQTQRLGQRRELCVPTEIAP